jgi:hypothetical protein
MYLVGGYKLTKDQVLEWCKPRGLEPGWGQVAFIVNDYLRNQDHPFRLLPCEYDGDPIYLLLTNQQVDSTATPKQYMLFEESDAARKVKEQMGIPGVEFITIANPFNQ